MRSLGFAWLSLVRQPARTVLGVLGIAAVGALLFDMLLLSRGLVISFEKLLDDIGFDVRVLATDAMPMQGPRLTDVASTVAAIAGLPEVDAVVPVRVGSAEVAGTEEDAKEINLTGVAPSPRTAWTILEGRNLEPTSAGRVPAVVVNQQLAKTLAVEPGATIRVRGTCDDAASALPPVELRVAGIADFPFDGSTQRSAAVDLGGFARVCGEDPTDGADMILVSSRPDAGSDAAVAAIRRIRPGLNAVTNEELMDRFQRTDFSYFRQISAVLAFITMFFGFLLITVLLTVSVNQRLAEIAALRALGLSRARLLADVLCESVLLVGSGGLFAVPIGLGLSVWLDGILKTMPGIPEQVHFFVFEPRALAVHGVLLAITALAAALYPMFLVARLPIAATLRAEVVS